MAGKGDWLRHCIPQKVSGQLVSHPNSHIQTTYRLLRRVLLISILIQYVETLTLIVQVQIKRTLHVDDEDVFGTYVGGVLRRPRYPALIFQPHKRTLFLHSNLVIKY